MSSQQEEKNVSTGMYDHSKKENKNNYQENSFINLMNTDDNKVKMLKKDNNASGCSEEIVDGELKGKINQSVLKEGTTETQVFKTDSNTTDGAKKKGNEVVHYKGSTNAAGDIPVKNTMESVANDKNSNMCNHNNASKERDNDHQHSGVAWGTKNKDKGDKNESSNGELGGRENSEPLHRVLTKSEVKEKDRSNLLPNKNCNDDDKWNSLQNDKVPLTQEEKEKFETSPPTCDKKNVSKDPPANDKRVSASKGENDDKNKINTSVEVPPSNIPPKGRNNYEEETHNAKQNNEKAENRKKENATMGEGAKPSESIHSANIRQNKNTNRNKNKGIVKDDLDVITEEEGKSEEGPKDDHPNDHGNSSDNRTVSGSSRNTCPIKRSEHQKDKENSNEESTSNNMMNQKNGNSKKFPALNNAKNGTFFKKEVRRNNANVGSSNRKSENYKTAGHSKREECWKRCRDKNEDYNITSGDNFRNGENYKNENSYTHGGNSPNSSKNSHGRNNEIHRVNERGFKNGNSYSYRNAVNGVYKNVGGTAPMGNSAKMNDNSHNTDNYKMSNYKNYHRNGNNEEPTDNTNRYGEKRSSHDHSAHWMNQNEEYERCERYEQNGKNESANFRRNNFKNKKESTGVKQKDSRFQMGKNYAKKYDANYFERNDSTNVGNHNGSASKKKVNSFIKQTENTNYSKHLPISGDTKGKEANGDDENDSNEVLTEGDTSRNSNELMDKQGIHMTNPTSSSRTYNNSGEKTHNNKPRVGKKNSIALGSPSHHANIDQDNKAYAKFTHTNDGKGNQKESISAGGNSDHIRRGNKWSFISKEDMSDSGRSKINNSGEKDVMKEIRRKEFKKEDYPTREGEGSGAHVKKIERREKPFTSHSRDSARSSISTNRNEYHHAASNEGEKDHRSSLQGEKDKNPKNSGKQKHSNGPENKRKILTPKTDQRNSNAGEVNLSSNFKEFECWMSGRYNKLLEEYINQENRKKNNSEIFEDEIKVYKLCSNYTNSGVEKDSHENLSHMAETLRSRDTKEEDTSRSKGKRDVQTNSEIENEGELLIEGRSGFSSRRNKGEHVDHIAGDNYNSGKSNYFSGSKNNMDVLNRSAAHEGEKKYYQRNNNYRPNHQKRSLHLLHKNGPQNNKESFLSSSPGMKEDNWGRGGEEAVENAIEGAKLEEKLGENTDTDVEISAENNVNNNTDNNAENNNDASVLPSMKKYGANNKNKKGEEKVSDGIFNRKNYYEKRPAGKRFGSSNITTKKLSSNNGFYKNKYHAGDQKNDYMKSEMNKGTFYKSNRQAMGQHNNKRNNWSTKLVNDRFGNRYEEPFGEPFGERLNERFSKKNNSNDMDNTNDMYYAPKKNVENSVLLRNEMGTSAAHNINPVGNSKKSNSTYLTAKSEGVKNRHYE
ncbi:conserved Plasmodium protein, unknown function [Plasmodium knowlesi strain H]|uniref:Uncharacterized protein n=3 Tax=Plasmodium knowlesi TaxID=5850 RepID=A0A5K1U462_PLAKH|nr:conserved Plasmodium protein, unknown function [Plasmodium knowlesi strain H]OTN64709.1 Uncharacterized protein PKNOH_S130174700 [Plasmodium knowlesi]CAA9988915.1 conserved Plasmodium protein, unknown function [Plasmodium knowlesi strain H]SBO24760.1 conserved Plasmodium protein, unknown function [Plasmodium knowlesi strain H]SBO28024.1 conserved Plasmodium protein, unknown function [Plasmodium knowlesi strain H]VVS78389.1 conserved Plasmodium protein, unknown function [Plasmodium knowlesi |eukprot:XP_002261262.1 hypothetical protein, conserved in Plasmodium species [Plasmodium knowlesi strain H]